ncbi:hypothetical protein MPER_09665, partial [Moniliophthora perniciosa FA553]
WQAYGFMHGVINTDNVSIMGLTIDYGPYAFMDTFDPLHICNHSDDGGRYAYKYQPSMIIYALRALLNALAPLIGYEHTTSKPAKANWAANASDEQVDEWRQAGVDSTKDEVERIAQEVMSIEYGRLMRRYIRTAFMDEFTARQDGERTEEERKQEMLNANPRFVLRQWVLEEVIRVNQKDDQRGKRLLAKVLHMACNPYQVWGNEEGEMRDLGLSSLEGEKEDMNEEEKEERRFCGVGEKQMRGYAQIDKS